MSYWNSVAPNFRICDPTGGWLLDLFYKMQGFPGCSVGEDTARNAGDLVGSLGQEDPLEKEMTTHSSILAWKITWTEEPSRLPSTGSQRVGHD